MIKGTPMHSNKKPFHFKQFSLFHHNSTMKVGTDAILLSAWSDVTNTKSILDVGTGCGIIAMLMQVRSDAKIDAVELDEKSLIEAKVNFSKLNKKNISIFFDDFNDFKKKINNNKYDLIISNPPFFTDSILPEKKSKEIARHNTALNYSQLCSGVSKLLHENGRFYVVLPHNEASNFKIIAKKHNLHISKQQIVYPKKSKLPNRINMEFIKTPSAKIITEKIVIRNENNTHTDEYKRMVDKYLIRI